MLAKRRALLRSKPGTLRQGIITDVGDDLLPLGAFYPIDEPLQIARRLACSIEIKKSTQRVTAVLSGRDGSSNGLLYGAEMTPVFQVKKAPTLGTSRYSAFL